ncbi:extracellular solute-binding protein [Cryobacterium algoritolerans]|uniref:Extracellular solute-binding protein n=1 Tax=Cryobacterium algoritolerans TaxID=1259184 RepID=A0A4R8WTY4_9MICO|nr:extracellular solute-binding protein [Cryobacterium algoritolerans]TFC14638.1 extracellular solute-binding protein [Cryobacterium algoritolerans]
MTEARATRRGGAWITIIVGLGMSALVVTGCSAEAAATSVPTAFSFLSITETPVAKSTLIALSAGACRDQNAALPLTVVDEPQASYDHRLQQLADQNSLPSVFALGTTPTLAQDLTASGRLLNVGTALGDLGLTNEILPAAGQAITNVYGSVIGLPSELTVEGFCYNKKILADNGVTPPATWDELLSTAATVKSAGLTSFAAAGTDGRPLARLVGAFISRTVGPDAFAAVAAGKATLTDPEYVAGAQAIADLGDRGYFSPGLRAIDSAAAENTFLTGKAAFFYGDSQSLADFTDAAKAAIGSENVGFLPFPGIPGGAGSRTQIGAAVGVPLGMSAATYDSKTADWLSCIAQNYGNGALSSHGVLTGLTVHGNAPVTTLTAQVEGTIAASKTSVLPFDTLFSAQATSTSKTNAARLVTGAISPAEFMKRVQADLG